MAPTDKSKYKEFRLTSFAIEHTTVVLVLTAIVIFLGVSSYLAVPKESSPEIVIPNIIVTTVYPGVAPRDIETLITRKLEEELNTIPDVKTITSTSTESYSTINVEFDAGVDMNGALQRVREKVDIAKPELPTAAEEPEIFEINFAEFPIMQVNVAGPYGLVRLRDVADDLKDDLEQIPSVLEVQLSGGLEREVQVDVDLAKLQFYNLAFDDVIDAIRDENVTIPGGAIDVGEMKYLVRVPGEYEDPEPIADIVIASSRGVPVYVRDIATVDFGFKERDSYARLDGNAVVSLAVKKRVGENIIETADAVRAVIAAAGPRFPPGTVVKVTSDQAEDIRDMVMSLENNIISGLLLVVGVLLFFLGARTAWFVGFAIPMSMLLSFIVIRAVGFSMNMVVLFSLILALGMLVDNAIVVVENIYRFREQGFDRREAAKYATAEVAGPVIASTATTLAAFAPMVFWPGIVGEFMKYLPLTLIITLSSSLFVALVIVPTLCALFLEHEAAPRLPLPKLTRQVAMGAGIVVVLVLLAINPLTSILLLATAGIGYGTYHYIMHPVGHWFMTHGLPRIIVHYERQLRWALGHRIRMLVGATVTMVVVIGAFMVLNAGIEFFPENIPPPTVYVQIDAPLGTRVDQTDGIVRRIENRLNSLPGRADFQSVVATTGSQVVTGFGGSGGGGGGTHRATVAVNFKDFQLLETDVFVTIETMRRTMSTGIAGADIAVEKQESGPPTGAAVALEITGDDPALLRRLGGEAVAILERSTVFMKLDGLEHDMAAGRPELVVEVDRERAALYGLNTRDIGMTVRNAINGTEASKYRDGRDEYDITVRLAKVYREDLNSLADLTIVPEGGGQIPLSSVASWHVGTGFGDIKRKDLDRVVTVTSDVRAGYNANAVLAEVEQTLAGFAAAMPPGYQMRFAGQQEEQQEAQTFLTGAFIMAVLLIGFILVSQFDSLTKPLIILTSVLLSTIGVLVGLMVFRMPFGVVMTGVGVISLAGIVVNNAIVLIHYIEILRHRDGLSRREAIVQGGKTRFRPVILTAITTVLSLVPLAIGLNIDFLGMYTSLNPDIYWGGEQAAWWGPMAIAVIAGLTFATFLTLVLVPVMYSLLDDLDDFMRTRFLPRKVDTDQFEIIAREAIRSGESHPVPTGVMREANA